MVYIFYTRRTAGRIRPESAELGSPTRRRNLPITASAPPGRQGHHYYLLNVFRRKLEFPDLKRAVREQQQLLPRRCRGDRDKASGTQLIQELRAEAWAAYTRMR